MIQSKALMQSPNLKPLLYILMIGLGVLFGGLAALGGLWLWLDYQADPTYSLLAALSTYLATVLPVSAQIFLQNEARIMGLPLTGETSAYWYMARAGGIISYLLLWLSVVWGLIMSTKITARLIPAPIAYGLHELLSILALLFIALHSVVLLGDSYINFNI